jgi:excisionase family DNA binding protein
MVRQAAGLLERAVGMATDAADVIVPATYSLDEAARRLGISCRHAYALLERGEFPVWVLHLGGRVVVLRMPLERLLEGDQPDPGRLQAVAG